MLGRGRVDVPYLAAERCFITEDLGLNVTLLECWEHLIHSECVGCSQGKCLTWLLFSVFMLKKVWSSLATQMAIPGCVWPMPRGYPHS